MAGGPSGPRTSGDSCWDSAGQKKRLAGALICADYDESMAMGYKIDMNTESRAFRSEANRNIASAWKITYQPWAHDLATQVQDFHY